VKLKLLLILGIFSSILLFSGCIQELKATIGMFEEIKTEDTSNLMIARELCIQKFENSKSTNTETCNSLTVTMNDKTYNCKFDEEIKYCIAQPN
tara:strand:- start:5179 stop:5460 length:282 start_codon:yes stop_codon:yes gene_type:complete